MSKPQPISSLSGLGPKSQQMLAQAGIHTVEQLRELGSIEAYLRTKKLNASASLNLLWGLESAITGEHWQTVAKKHRTSLLMALEQREKSASSRLSAQLNELHGSVPTTDHETHQ